MFVREILHRKGHEIKTVAPDEALEFCAAHMKLERVGALVVCDAGGALQGVITERDLVRALVDCGPRALKMAAGDYMDPKPLTCAPDDTIASVAGRMTQARVRHMPVLDDGRIVGVISIGDIVKARFEELELERETLRDLAGMHQVAS